MTDFKPISPDRCYPAVIEEIFRAAMIPISPHEPFGPPEERGAFACTDMGDNYWIYVQPKEQTIMFNYIISLVSAEDETDGYDEFSNDADSRPTDPLQALTGDLDPKLSVLAQAVMKQFTMIRVVCLDRTKLLFEYTINTDYGVYPPMLITAFRRYAVITSEAIRTTLLTFRLLNGGASIKLFKAAEYPQRPLEGNLSAIRADNLDDLVDKLFHGGEVASKKPVKKTVKRAAPKPNTEVEENQDESSSDSSK